ncbi:MAG: putative porin [Planctomycetota bacterium]
MRKTSLNIIAAVLMLTCTISFADEEKKEEIKKSWFEKIEFKGDFRYKHEISKEEDNPQRSRERLRLRLSMDAEVNTDFSIGARLITGSDDPRSTDQTFTGGFSTKPFSLDRAFFEWTLSPINEVAVTGGKMSNPLFIPGKSNIIWDGDLSPEGLIAKYSPASGNLQPFVTAGSFWIEERKSEKDSWLAILQTGCRLKLADGSQFTLALGYFDYSAAKGYLPFYDSAKSFGNTLDTNGKYANDFNEINIAAEFKFELGNMPTTIFGDYVTNNAADNDSTGVLFGFSLSPKPISISFDYRKLEKDAVIGAFTDSSSWGGGTNGKGMRLSISYEVATNITIGANVYMDTKDLSNGKDCQIYQFELLLKF